MEVIVSAVLALLLGWIIGLLCGLSSHRPMLTRLTAECIDRMSEAMKSLCYSNHDINMIVHRMGLKIMPAAVPPPQVKRDRQNAARREIKFKGLLPDSHKWVYGDLVQYESGECAIIVGQPSNYDTATLQVGMPVKVVPETVGQFTGLYDKHGVEIYEGDIIRFKSGQKLDEKGKWIDSTHDVSVTYSEARFSVSVLSMVSKNVEVVGNIHEVKTEP